MSILHKFCFKIRLKFWLVLKKCSRESQDKKFQINFSSFGRGKNTHNISKVKLKQTLMTEMPDLLNMIQGIQEKEQSGKGESSVTFSMDGDIHWVEGKSRHVAS